MARDIRVRSHLHSFLGLRWWTSQVVGHSGLDLCGPRPTSYSFDVERAEDKAVARFVNQQIRERERIRNSVRNG